MKTLNGKTIIRAHRPEAMATENYEMLDRISGIIGKKGSGTEDQKIYFSWEKYLKKRDIPYAVVEDGPYFRFYVYGTKAELDYRNNSKKIEE